MSDTIVLDPYDVWQLGLITGRTFEELMGAGIDLHVEEGVILPHLMMREETGGCFFLGEDGRCTIHAYRPGICRLFPLGRHYDKEKTSYFIVPDGCVKGGLSKVRIDRWLGIPDLPAYENYKARWHSLIRTLAARVAAEQSDETRRNIDLYFLRLFFMLPYKGDQSADTFYEEVADRMKKFADVVL
jgi:Fe-S-cluster containining protein